MKGNGSGHTMEGLLQLNRELELKNLFLLSENKRLEEKLSKLCDELRYLRRTLFGRSSERVTDAGPGQLKFAFYEELAVCAASQPVNQTGAAHRAAAPSQRKPVRKPLPDYLERRREVIEPDPLPEGSKHIGNEITEILEYVPGQLYVREIIRRKYALKDGGVVIGDLPGGIPLPKSNAGPSLLAHLLVSKYQDHLPFYRQIEMFRRMGVELAASTVNGWTHAAISLLQPLYDRLKKEVLAAIMCRWTKVSYPCWTRTGRERPARVTIGWSVRPGSACCSSTTTRDPGPSMSSQTCWKVSKGPCKATDTWLMTRMKGNRGSCCSVVGRMPAENSSRHWEMTRHGQSMR